MADNVKFDIESFQQLPPDTQAAAEQLIKGLNQVSGAGIVSLGENLDQWKALNEYTGLAGKALTGLSVAQSIAEGNQEQAYEQAAEWLTGEALSNGFSEAIQQTTRSDFASRYGWNIGSQDMHKAWSDAVGGAMADAAQAGAESLEAAGEWLKDRVIDYNSTPERIIVDSQEKADYINTVHDQLTGGLDEYGHFENLPYSNSPREDSLRWNQDRPYQSSLPQDIKEATREAVIAVVRGDVPGHIEPALGLPPWQRVGAVDELSDFVSTVPGYRGAGPGLNQAMNFDLNVGDSLNINLRDDVANHAKDYIFHAQIEEGRDLDFNDIADDVNRIADQAELFSLEMRQMRSEFTNTDARERYFDNKAYNHAFEGGSLNAGNAAGALLIGRDGGQHSGSEADDLSIGASVAKLGGGDDLAILDNETGYRADGGIGKDILIGGARGETLIGGTDEDHMRGDAGEDTLYGTAPDMEDDGVRDYLSGGADKDTYYVGHNDVIEATPDGDRDDIVHFNGLKLEGPISGTDDKSTGAAGEIYALDDDGKTLSVTHGESKIEIQNFTNGDFGIHLPQQEASLATPTNIKLETALGMLTEDQVTLNLQAKGTGISTPAHAAINHPDAIQMMQTLKTEGVTSFKAEVTPVMDIEERVGTILNAGQVATHEAGLLMPEEERNVTAEAASNQQFQVAEHVNDDDYSYSV